MEESLGQFFDKLPRHMLEQVMLPRLSLKDVIRFGAVSRSWRCMAAEIQSRLHQLPWLMISRDKKTQTATFYSLSDSNFYTLKLSRLASKSFCSGSCLERGFLIMAHEDGNFLFNPFSQIHINLPEQYLPSSEIKHSASFTDYSSYFTKSILHSSSIMTSSTSKYVVAALSCDREVIEICGAQSSEWLVFGDDEDSDNEEDQPANADLDSDVGRDNQVVTDVLAKHNEEVMVEEQKEDDEKLRFSDLLFCKGMLFGLTTSTDKLVSFDISDLSKPLTCGVLDILPLNVPSFFLNVPCELYYRSYLVESRGELLMVHRYTNYYEEDDNWMMITNTTKFVVYRLHESNDLLQWDQLESLGDQMLFLGRNASMSISATGIPGVEGNCIYFTDDYWPHFWNCRECNSKVSCLNNGIFYLDDGRFEPFFIHNDCQSIKSQPFWIMPHNIV